MEGRPWFNIVKIAGGERRLLDTIMAEGKFDALAAFGHSEGYPEIDGVRVPAVICINDGGLIVPEPVLP